MEKLKLHTPNLTAQNIEKLVELFRNCVTEAKDEKTGKLKRQIDFDLLRQEPNGEEVFPIRNDGSEGRWRLGKKALLKIVHEKNALFERREDGSYIVFEKIRTSDARFKSYRTIISDAGTAADGTARLKELFGGKAPFDFPKPTQLLIKLFEIGALDDQDIVLDFFAGSGTTADAVMQHASVSDLSLNFILVQIPQKTDGIFPTIAEIAKERIRRAGAKIKTESSTTAPKLDVGFRVFKIDTSNMRDVYYSPDELKRDDLVAHTDNIKEDRSSEDLLFQVLVDWGVDLALPVEQQTLAGKKVFFVDGNALAACFESNISEELVKELSSLNLVSAMGLFLDDHPELNVAAVATPAIATAKHTALLAAKSALGQADKTLRMKRSARDIAVAEVRKLLIGLRRELSMLLTNDDPRWVAFGFNVPTDLSVPEVPEGVTVIPGGAGRGLVSWNHAVRADRYHAYKQTVGVDAEPVRVATVRDLSCDVDGLVSGSTVQFTVTALNAAGESLESAVVELAVP